jgi:glucose-1-phosphate cytidylyltransferase
VAWNGHILVWNLCYPAGNVEIFAGGRMKVCILAGGIGSRLAEETEIRPKPMVEIGSQPILWHIMMHYSHYGLKEFVIALGYKGEYIKRYFVDYFNLSNNLTVNFSDRRIAVHENAVREDWTVDLVDTGQSTATGGRIKRLAPYLGGERFLATYGDGVSNVDLQELLRFHRSHGRLATLTALLPPARFGKIDLDGDVVVNFSEKPQLGEGWINGGFFVFEPGVLDYIDGDDTDLAREPFERLARDGQLMAYRHDSFWQCMDTIRDKELLNKLCQQGRPPWQMWRTPSEGVGDGTQWVHRHGADTVVAGSGT